jgi:hypothetical protein
MAKTQELIKKPSAELEEVPSYLQHEGPGRGSENVSSEDISIPRLQIIQLQSPEMDEDNVGKYIFGAKVGQMFNTLTRETFDQISFCNVYCRKEFAIFTMRSAGGGFKGSAPTLVEAQRIKDTLPNPETIEIVETKLHFGLILSDDGEQILGEVVIPMTSTKLKISRDWEGLIRLRCGEKLDRYAATWTIATKKEKNDKGTYYNFKVGSGPWAKEHVYKRAEQVYKAIISGTKDIDRSDMMGDDVVEEKDF